MPLVLLSFPFFPFVGVPCKKAIQEPEHRSILIFLTSNNFLGNKQKTKNVRVQRSYVVLHVIRYSE